MGALRTIGIAAAVAGITAAGLAIGSGGPPPDPPVEPAPDTVVAHGSAQSRVAEPEPKRTDRSVDRAVREARARAIPRAVDVARAEARALAAAAGLEVGDPVGIARDVAPAGWYDQDSGRFGPGRWCGPITTWSSDGGRRVRRTHHGCHKPSRAAVQVTVTFAAR